MPTLPESLIDVLYRGDFVIVMSDGFELGRFRGSEAGSGLLGIPQKIPLGPAWSARSRGCPARAANHPSAYAWSVRLIH
jgi:hypothetical protein